MDRGLHDHIATQRPARDPVLADASRQGNMSEPALPVGVDREACVSPRVRVAGDIETHQNGSAHATNSASASRRGNTRSRDPVGRRRTTSSIPIDA